jgi:hypothetical protein
MARDSSVARAPSITSAGSPGIKRISAKISTITSSSTGIICSTRFKM